MVKRFAEIDKDNIVLRVINAENQEWCETNLGGIWIETFEGSNMAAIGYKYIPETNNFEMPLEWIISE